MFNVVRALNCVRFDCRGTELSLHRSPQAEVRDPKTCSRMTWRRSAAGGEHSAGEIAERHDLAEKQTRGAPGSSLSER